MTAITVAVLAYNEHQNIVPVLEELDAWRSGFHADVEVLVVDDGSSDDTAELAESYGARVLRRAQNGGMGAALKTAARAARGEWLTFLPADGQIPPESVQTLYEARGDAALVLSVYRLRNDGAARKVLSWGVRALITVVHGVRLRSEGPYLIRTSLLDPDQLDADTFFLNFEVPIRALRAGLKAAEVTIECRPRLAGVSKTARPGRALQVGAELLRLRRRLLTDALRRARGADS
ncbi:MAG: glycosyltransferase [Myxococcota bacterium]